MEKSSELNPIERTYRRLTAAGQTILPLFSGNPNDQGILFPPEILENSYWAYFQDQHYQPHPKGLPAAREAIRDYYAGQGAVVNADDILLTAGTSEAFFHLFTALGQPGDHFLAPHPSYPLFDHLARLARVELRTYPLVEERDWALDVDALAARIDDKTRGIVLISPNNPTGAVHTAEELAAVTALADRHRLPLIVDEVFSEFYFGTGAYPRAMAVARPRLLFTLNGISKMFALPALKLGWIAVSGDGSAVAAAVDRLETQVDAFLACHTPIQEALPGLFAQSAPFLSSYRATVARRRDLALDLLGKIPGVVVVPPRGGFYLVARLDAVRREEEDFVIDLMEKKGIFVHPGYFFDIEEGVHAVISFLTRDENLRRGLESLRQFLGSSGLSPPELGG